MGNKKSKQKTAFNTIKYSLIHSVALNFGLDFTSSKKIYMLCDDSRSSLGFINVHGNYIKMTVIVGNKLMKFKNGYIFEDIKNGFIIINFENNSGSVMIEHNCGGIYKLTLKYAICDLLNAEVDTRSQIFYIIDE